MEIPSSFNYFTGTSFVQGQFGKNYKNMFNYEMKRALDDLRTTYGIDPSKDSTPEEMESIKNKLYEKFFDKSLDEKERQRIDFMLELFRTTGGSKGVSDLNNIVVKNEGVSLPIGPQFSRKGGEIEEDKEMVEGIADILSQVKNRENRNQIAQNMIGDFKRENVKYDLNKFLSMANLMKKGGQMIKRADGSYSRRGLWDNIRANSGSGKKPTPEMLEQERKIRRESKEIGGIFMGQKLFRPRKSSIFATGGLTPLQAYDFLFGEEDEYTGNSAPDMSEVNTLKDENKKLAESLEQQNEINERLNRKLRMSNSYNAAMDEVNRPFVYNQDDNKDYDYSIIDDDPSAWDWDNTGSGPLNQNNKSGNQNSGLSWRQAPIGNYKEDLGVLFNPNVGVRITSGFKFRKMDNKFHYGVDIGVPMNTEIYSPVDGVVSNVWTTGKGGLQLSIRTATGERFGFAHLNKTDLKIGDQISKSQFVGMSGTGGTGPHLHFTVTDANGKKVDPVKYFGHGAWNMADHVPQYKSSKK
jgi:murein DD-endopeptidase MepM/ murein hydrolase activator NlpD